jgi:hypothetical protein
LVAAAAEVQSEGVLMDAGPTHAAAAPSTIVQLDADEREALRGLTDLDGTAVVAAITEARSADELDAAIVEVKHRCRLLRAVEDGVLELDAAIVDIIRANRAETLDMLEADRRSLARQRAGDADHHYDGMTAAESVQKTLGYIDRLLDEINVYDRLLGHAGTAMRQQERSTIRDVIAYAARLREQAATKSVNPYARPYYPSTTTACRLYQDRLAEIRSRDADQGIHDPDAEQDAAQRSEAAQRALQTLAARAALDRQQAV